MHFILPFLALATCALAMPTSHNHPSDSGPSVPNLTQNPSTSTTTSGQGSSMAHAAVDSHPPKGQRHANAISGSPQPSTSPPDDHIFTPGVLPPHRRKGSTASTWSMASNADAGSPRSTSPVRVGPAEDSKLFSDTKF
jgi:hypothetical protein